MEDNRKNYDWDLMAKVIAKEVDDQVSQEFYHRLNSDDQLKSEFEAFQEYWQLSQQTTPVTDEQTEAAWKKQKEKITLHQGSNRPYSRFLKVAAIIVLVGSIVMISQYFNQVSIIETITYSNAIQKIRLPDGSIIHLNENSKISYDEASFNQNRTIRFEGEAYFDIESNPSSPFKIKFDEALVTVLGTSFTISTRDKTHDIYVKEGKVAYQVKENTEHLLTAGQVAHRSSGKTSVSINQNPNALSWVTGKMIFKNTPLSDVFPVIEKTFHRELTVSDPSIWSECLLTAEYQDQSLEEVLVALSTIYGLEAQYQGQNIIIEGEACNH